MSTGAQPASGIATYRILRELGARSQRSYAAIREPHELVVVHRFVRRGAPPVDGAVLLSPEELGLLLRDAQCLAKNWHPNIARIKHVDLAKGDLTVASELIDGSTLGDLFTLVKAGKEPFPLDVLVRVLLDVLAGIHGIHALRDGRSVTIGAIHGELCPENIVVGRDGVTRIINTLRPRPLRIAVGSEGVGYAAPEMLDGGVVDGRADVHAVGVILWEALTGRRLYDEKDPARVLSRQREIDIPRPVLPLGSPYAPLADITMRALAFDPALRFRTAGEMASDLRKLPAPRIATGSVVAGRVLALDGERIRRRRIMLDPTSSGARPRASKDVIAAALANGKNKAGGRAASGGRLTFATPSGAFAVPRPGGHEQARERARDEEESEPPPSIELVEDVSSVPPPTVRRDERPGARPPPPMPARVASPPKPPDPSAPIDEKVTIPGTPAIAGPVLVRPPSSPAIEERVTVPGAPAGVASPVVHHGGDLLVVEAPSGQSLPSSALARSTSSAIVEEGPRGLEESSNGRSLPVGAGVTAAGVLESLDGVDVPQEAPRRRRSRALALAAVLLLAGVLVVAFRSGAGPAASPGAPTPSVVATITTAPLAPSTSAPAAATGSPAGGSPTSVAASTTAPAGADEEAVPPIPQPGSAAGPGPEPSAEDAPKRAPRPQSNRRYEPLGI